MLCSQHNTAIVIQQQQNNIDIKINNNSGWMGSPCQALTITLLHSKA